MTAPETQQIPDRSHDKIPERVDNSWQKLDKLLLVFGCLLAFGDGVELYLPGVVSQQISCEMKLESFWKSALECVQYFTMAVAIAIAGLLADRFGCQKVTLFSLYVSSLSSVVCAIVANFSTLLLSRALIGFTVGLNYSVHSVMIGKLASKKAIVDAILMILGMTYSFGGVWSAVLGYLALEALGWRTFILVTSLPLFIPPIFMLHCCFQEKENSETQEEQAEIIPQVTHPTVQNYVTRVIKLITFRAICDFLGWMTILLVPSLIQMLKKKKVKDKGNCHLTVTRDAELLLLGLVTFASALGRIFIHFARKKVSFCKRQLLVAVLNVICFIVMLHQENLAVAVMTNFIVKFLFGVATTDTVYIAYDESYYGTEKYTVGSSIAEAGAIMGAVAGLALVAFTPPLYVMITAAVVAAVQVPVVVLWTEAKDY